MPCIITSESVDNAVRSVLAADGYIVSASRRHGENGVDLLATKGRRRWYIETIAFHTSPSKRASDFYQAFFRAISRLQHGAKRIAIALPQRFAQGLPQRAAHHGEGWRRLGITFPELEIWLVDCARPSLERTRWSDWLDGNSDIPPRSVSKVRAF